MKFGLMAPYQLAPVEDGRFAADLGRCAEDMGFESIWAVDHVVMCPGYESEYPYDPSGRSPFDENVIQPDPLIWLTWVASATTTLKLGTGILILPLRNPTVLAKETASLDRLSGGRLLLGIGVGWVEEESKAVGMEFGNRGRRCDEYVESMRSLWNEPVSSYQGQYVAFDNVVSLPKPASTGGVPILVGGHSPAAARRAGRLGDGFFPLGVFGAELDDLLEFSLGLIRPGDVGERHLGRIRGDHLRLGPSELKGSITPALHGAENPNPERNEKDPRQHGHEDGTPPPRL